MSPPPRDNPEHDSPNWGRPSNGPSSSRGISSNFCSAGRYSKCVPSTDTHTGACRRRELLGRSMLDYLRDSREAERRAKATRDLGHPIGLADVLVLYLIWYKVQAELIFGATPEIANVAIHRLIPDLGDFVRVYEVAEQIRMEEILNKQDQRRFDHEDRIL